MMIGTRVFQGLRQLTGAFVYLLNHPRLCSNWYIVSCKLLIENDAVGQL